MVKKFTFIVSLFCLSSLMVGCSNSLAVKVTEDDVVKYNTVVDKTIESYSNGVAFSQKVKDELFEFILTDKLPNNNSLTIHNKDTITDEIKEEFKNNILLDDFYFTSFGASNLREVIIFNSPKNRLITTVIWNTDGSIESLERVVIKL